MYMSFKCFSPRLLTTDDTPVLRNFSLALYNVLVGIASLYVNNKIYSDRSISFRRKTSLGCHSIFQSVLIINKTPPASPAEGKKSLTQVSLQIADLHFARSHSKATVYSTKHSPKIQLHSVVFVLLLISLKQCWHRQFYTPAAFNSTGHLLVA